MHYLKLETVIVTSKKQQACNVILLILVAFTLRISIVQTLKIWTGMTWDYQAAALMLSADYGYRRTAGHYWTMEIGGYSQQLAKQGKIITPQDRPDLDITTLRPIQHRLPGYPAFLYGIYQLFGEPFTTWAGMAQALLTAFYPLLIYALAMRLFNHKTYAWIAAWLSALYLPFAFLSVVGLPIAFVSGFVLIALYCCARGLQERCYRDMFLTGLAIGAGCYFKSHIIYLWIFLGLYLLLVQKGWKRPILSISLMALGTYMLLLPWAYSNYAHSGKWLWGSTMTWVSIWKGVGENPNPWGVIMLDSYGTDIAKQNGFEDDVSPQAGEWFKTRFLSYLKEDPLFFINATIKRLPFTIAAPFSMGFANPNRTNGLHTDLLNKDGRTYLDVLFTNSMYIFKAYWERLIVMCISFAGSIALVTLACLSRERRREALLLLVVPAYLITLHSAFLTGPRYLMPMIPCQLIAMVFVIKAIRDNQHQAQSPTVD